MSMFLDVQYYLGWSWFRKGEFFFRFKWDLNFFSKYFRLSKGFYLNFFSYKKFKSKLNEGQILFTKIKHTDIILRFQKKPMVLLLWPIVFVKNFFMYFLNFAFICCLFCSLIIFCSHSKTHLSVRRYKWI